MTTRRCVRFTLLATLSLATASAVMAARPSSGSARPQHNAATPTRLPLVAGVGAGTHQATKYAVEIPRDLMNHRLKVRLNRELGARVLPNGQLFSMSGHDLAAVDVLLESLGVQLTPATTVSENTIQKLQRRAEIKSGGSFADFAATFWVNGNPQDMGRVAQRLSRLDEFEVVTFARQAPQPATPVHMARRTTVPSQNRNSLTLTGDVGIENNTELDEIRAREAQDEANLRQAKIGSLEAIERLRQKRFADSDASRLSSAVDNQDRPPSRGGSRANSCCFHISVEIGPYADASGPLYLRGYQNDVVDEDGCDIVAQDAAKELLEDDYIDFPNQEPPGGWITVVAGTEFNEDGTAPGQCRAYGACCTDQLEFRGGSDTYRDGCDDDWNGSFGTGDGPDVPGSVGLDWTWDQWTKAYANCAVCVLRFGMCCLEEEAVGQVETWNFEDTEPGTETNDKFRACDVADAVTPNAPGRPTYVPNWPPSDRGGLWWQPDLEPLPLESYTGHTRSAQVDFMPQWQGRGLPDAIGPFPWDATESNPWIYTNPWVRMRPGRTIVIGSARLVTNNDATSADSRCEQMQGQWAGYIQNENELDQYPALLFGGDRLCQFEETILGGCMNSTGGIEVKDKVTCDEWGAGSSVLLPPMQWGSNLGQRQPNPLWLADMIDPGLLIPDPTNNALVHRIHQNQWRPTWAIWCTPPSVACAFDDCGDATGPTDPPAFIGTDTWCPPLNPFLPLAAFDPSCVIPPDYQTDPANYLVPPWEYMGSRVEWTGWDPSRWFDEGVTLGLSEVVFDKWFPPLDGSVGLRPAASTGDDVGIFDPGFYAHGVKHGFEPTCDEFESSDGLATQRGVSLPWDDPATGEPKWLVYPTWNQWVYGWQVDNMAGISDGGVTPQKLDPFNDGWNRWTETIGFFDYGQITPDPVFFSNARYLQSPASGETIWTYQGDFDSPEAMPPGGGEPSDYNSIVFPYLLPSTDYPLSGNATRGSCFFPHSMRFPTLLETPDLEGEQECYVGNYCNDDTCCDYVETLMPGCCAEGGPHIVWDSECIQVAVDQYLLNQGNTFTEYADYTCRGITPFLVPSWPVSADGPYDPTYAWPPSAPAPPILYTPGQYNSDPRNVAINPYLDAVLPEWIDPSYIEGSCEVADTNNINRLAPPLPVPPTDGGWPNYAQVRDQAGRLFQFMPRCQGIFSSAGQCSVPGSESGRSAWDAVAEDESIIIGCQDFDCCMRVIATMLQEKDSSTSGNDFSDLEWINFAHMGYSEDDPLLPALAGQWTPYMAMKARDLCYPSVETSAVTPDFFPLQLHAGAEAYQQRAGAPGDPSSEFIEGADGTSVTDSSLLRQLIYAPFSWSDPMANEGSAACVPAHQNIFEMCPAPYYRAEGVGLWPANNPFELGNQDFFKTWTSGISYLSQARGEDIDPYGDGVRIAVLAESAWLQQWEPPLGGPIQGAEHEDLIGNVILEGPAIGLPSVTLDFSDQTLTARGTAVLGVIAAEDNDIGVTGMAHQADTYFFPTRAVPAPGLGPQERLEDAFLHALSILNSGDVLLLAFESSTADGFLLDDPEVQSLVAIAAASDINVIVPAGDRGAALPGGLDFPGIQNVTVVGAAVPGSDDQYLRWWSSNYSDVVDTVISPQDGLPNICAWGGAVTTTGGNANLTLLTIEGAADVDPDTGSYQLTQAGRAQSYTNDFGSQIDGTVAAAAQIAASVACAQSLCITLYDDPILPNILQDRMIETAVFGNAGGQPAGLVGSPANAGGLYTWDLNQEAIETRSVGRIPRLGNLAESLAFDVPDDGDFTEEIPFRIIRMDIVSGELQDGSRFSLAIQGDDEWVWMKSEEMSAGYPPINFYTPGPIYYSSHRDYTDILLTCAISDEVIATTGFGVFSNRAGPDQIGRFKTYLFDFSRNAWRQFTADTTPSADAPQEFFAEPWPGAPSGLSRYLEPSSGRLYIRILTNLNTVDDYNYYLDFVELRGLTGSSRP